MKSHASCLNQYKSLREEIHQTEKTLTSLKEKSTTIRKAMMAPFIKKAEEYIKVLLKYLKTVDMENYGNGLPLNPWWDWDEDIVIKSGEYTYANDYYGDVELITKLYSLSLDEETDRVMVNYRIRYCDTNWDDDTSSEPFGEDTESVNPGDDEYRLLTSILERLEDLYVHQEDDNYALAYRLSFPQEFSLGALELDSRYDMYGNLVFRKGSTSIRNGEFKDCDKVKVAHIPQGVTIIGEDAFKGCTSLEYVDIPDSVTEIGDGAFKGCEKLEKIIFPEGLKSIGKNAFEGCINLKCINLPNSLESIGKDVFKGTEPIYISFGKIRLTQKTAHVNDQTLLIDRTGEIQTSDFREFTELDDCRYFAFPEGYTKAAIDEVHPMISNLRNVREIHIPSSIEELDTRYARPCLFIAKVSVSPYNKVYDSRNNCNAIIETSTDTLIAGCADTIIPETVKIIDEGAFSNCEFLHEIHIPASVQIIDEGAFGGCSHIEKITVDKSNPTYDSRMDCNAIIETASGSLIAGCANTTIPDGVKIILKSSFSGCVNLKTAHIPQGVTDIGDFAFYECWSLEEVTFPDTLIRIGKNAFEYCLSLTGIHIPANVQRIDEEAFQDCSHIEKITVDKGNPTYDSRMDCNAIIETASGSLIAGCANTTIPDGVKIILNNSFYCCKNLKTAHIPQGVTDIGDYAFSGCSSLEEVTLPDTLKRICRSALRDCSSLTEIHIPEGVTEIGDLAFSGCSSLKELYIPDSVSSIGEMALRNCNLETLSIPEGLDISETGIDPDDDITIIRR